jgi:hypothetical protein
VLTLFSLRGSGSSGSYGESAVIEGEREGVVILGGRKKAKGGRDDEIKLNFGEKNGCKVEGKLGWAR